MTLRANTDETDHLVVTAEQDKNRNPCEEQRDVFGLSCFPDASELPARPRPNPEEVAAKRRSFTAEYKLVIRLRPTSPPLKPALSAAYCAVNVFTPRTWPLGVAKGGPASSRA